MTRQRGLKRRIRELMRERGVTYTAARDAIVAKPPPPTAAPGSAPASTRTEAADA